MDLVRHHYPCVQPIPLFDRFSVEQSIPSYARKSGLGQPAWTRRRAVQLAVELHPAMLRRRAGERTG
jgi:hypothetical protein